MRTIESVNQNVVSNGPEQRARPACKNFDDVEVSGIVQRRSLPTAGDVARWPVAELPAGRRTWTDVSWPACSLIITSGNGQQSPASGIRIVRFPLRTLAALNRLCNDLIV